MYDARNLRQFVLDKSQQSGWASARKSIYPVQPRKEPNFSYRLIRAVYPVFRLLFPNQVRSR
jgi:hypothetical protein